MRGRSSFIIHPSSFPDGAATYAYDSANRLIGVSGQALTTTYRYNGLGDRVSQTVNGVTTNYTLDLNAGLTQVLVASPQPLTPSTQTFYLYGLSRIGELQPGGFVYHLTDALGSVRQLVDAGGEVKLARSYEPYGSVLSSSGNGSSVFAFTGESYDLYTELLMLRSRWLSLPTGRFLTKDIWPPDYNTPSSLNDWLYAFADPINFTDPSGLNPNCGTLIGDYEACGLIRFQEIVAKKQDVLTLIELFQDPELNTLWFLSAGETVDKRPGWILDLTKGGEGPTGAAAGAGIVPLNFGVDFGSDCHFAYEFRDQRFYPVWNAQLIANGDTHVRLDETSNQVGHFLSAVNNGRSFWRNFPVPYYQRFDLRSVRAGVTRDLGIRVIIGHEQVADTKGQIDFYNNPTDEDVSNFWAALKADEEEDSTTRDRLLWGMLRFKSAAFGYIDKDRKGNSLQDLRLSLKGVRFAMWVEQNSVMPPEQGGDWLRYNLAALSPQAPR